MPAFITLDAVSSYTPDGRRLFENLSLAFGAERTGVIGRNGVGKTTLSRVILGELPPSTGAISRRGVVRALRQATTPLAHESVADLLGVGAELDRLARLGRGDGTPSDLAEADWTLEARLAQALARVGLPDLDLLRAARSLSGGEATRASLAGAIAAEPDLLVLDEPTNNLDEQARALVLEVLRDWRGGAVVISHDRAVLRQMDRILELSELGGRLFGGDFDLYSERKAQDAAAAARDLTIAERAAAAAEREIQVEREKKARRDASGRKYATKGIEPKMYLHAQAQRAEASASRGGDLAERQREKVAGDLAEAQARVERLQEMSFELPPSRLPAGKLVIWLDAVSVSYGGTSPIIRDVSLRISGPERVAIVGPNGAGKTTLIKLLAGELAPTQGQVTRAVPAALVDQHAAVLRQDETLIEAFRRLNPEASDNDGRAALARFLFRNVASDKRVGQLSGGERLRAALACIMANPRPPQLLILDEPTNALDLASIAAVESALVRYDGALVVASHDPDFLAAIGIAREVVLGRGETGSRAEILR